MHKKPFNKLTALVMVLALLIGMMPAGMVFAGSSDIIITSYNSDKSEIEIDDTFELTVNVQDTTGSHKGDVYAQITSSDFSEVNGAQYKPFNTKDATNDAEFKLELERVGQGNSISFTFTSDGNVIGSQTLTISEAAEYRENNNPPKPNDPDLSIESTGEIKTFNAGEEIELEIPIKNSKYNTAYNVEVSITNDTSTLPFIVENAKLATEVKNVTKKEGGVASFTLVVSPLAKSKVHKLEIAMKCPTNTGTYTTTDVYYIRVENNEIEPILGVTDYRFVEETCTAGKEDAVLLTIGNKGTIDARDIRVTLDGFTKDGIRLHGDVDTKAIDEVVAKGDESVFFKFMPAPSAKSGVYELKATIDYIDTVGNEYSKQSMIYVTVEGNDSSAIDMEVENLQAPQQVSAGDTFSLTFDLANKSDIVADWVEVSVNYPAGFVATSAPKEILRDVQSGDPLPLTFDFMAKTDIETGHNDFFVNVKYRTEGETEAEAQTIQEYVGLPSQGSSGLGRPKILIKDYNYGGESVMAGEEFDLTLSFYNTNADEVVKNIKVSLSSDESVFSPVDMSSSFFIEQIGRQEVFEYTLKLKTKRDAQVKAYNLNLKMEYEDSQGNAYDAQDKPFMEEESLGINVSQPIRLEVSDPMLPFDAQAGAPADIELEFYNMGRSAMYNMFVKLEGDFPTQDGTYYVGNFESGRSEYFMGTVIPQEPGELSGKIVFTFEDALGNPSTVEKPFSMMIAEGGEMEMGGEVMPPDGEFPPGPDGMIPEEGGDEGGMDWKLIVGGIAVLAVIGYVIWRRRKRKQQLLMELEEDDE